MNPHDSGTASRVDLSGNSPGVGRDSAASAMPESGASAGPPELVPWQSRLARELSADCPCEGVIYSGPEYGFVWERADDCPLHGVATDEVWT